ncbi:hypothetical protein [Saccharopolyspora hordei]|uniref:Uncharacterized protein n=1 Tax=Saccharopolyspora hordei TaxID=1838 RepID=A0A853APK1_9PSEU|nr:hypothetical protein [Saccharopolyspora hordei]NYI82410.1 hypothetical protein [Saccharopolyspora hordei]
MIYVLAAIGALTIAVLVWKAFGPAVTDRPHTRKAPIPPDDDPEFLRRLDEQRRQSRPTEED